MHKTIILVVLLFTIEQHASAQWSLGAYAGWTKPFKTDVQIDHPATQTHLFFSDLPFETRPFDRPLYYGLRGGYLFWPHVGAEFEWIHLKVYAEVDEPVLTTGELFGQEVRDVFSADRFLERLNVSHGLNMLLGNLLIRFPARSLGSSRLHLTGRLGIGPTLSHTEAMVLGVAREHYETGGLAAQLAGGAEVLISGKWSFVGEYKFTWTRQQLRVGLSEVEFPVGTHHIVSGIAYRF